MENSSKTLDASGWGYNEWGEPPVSPGGDESQSAYSFRGQYIFFVLSLLLAIYFLLYIFLWQYPILFSSFVGNKLSHLSLALANKFFFICFVSNMLYIIYYNNIDITFRGQPERIVLKPFPTNYTNNLYFTIYPLWQVLCFRAAISCLRVYTSCLLAEVSSSSAFQRLNREAIMWTLGGIPNSSYRPQYHRLWGLLHASQ